MELSEKLLNLRKANDLTQEQLAEKIGISRQSVSKWESGQAVPELDKIVALCEIFHITTDQLLKPSELDLLSVKTQMLENQQKSLENTFQKKERKKRAILGCVSIYLIAFSVMIMLDRISWADKFSWLWYAFPGITLHLVILCLATAAAIMFYLRSNRRFQK